MAFKVLRLEEVIHGLSVVEKRRPNTELWGTPEFGEKMKNHQRRLKNADEKEGKQSKCGVLNTKR